MATAEEIFADEGKLGFLMTLSAAAARLRSKDTNPTDKVKTVEIAKSGINAPTAPFQADAWNVAKDHLTLLDTAEMPSLAPVKSGNKDFPATGLESGIYTNLNGAALVGRSDDALFVAFRGSNDIDSGIGNSPDSRQWGDKRSDHYKLFSDLNAAIKLYLKAHPEITKVYITGHSLGGGMVNAFMQSHKSDKYEGVSFGSIRYGSGASRDDDRVTNVWNDTDIALALGGRADGDAIRFKVVGPDAVSEHMPWLYQAEIKFVSDLGYDIDQLSSYARVVFGAQATGLFSYGIGTGRDSLAGTNGRDLMLGGSQSDRMQGQGGRDRIDGGTGGHDAAIYTEKTVGIEVTLDGANWTRVRVGGSKEDRIRSIEDIAGGRGADIINGDGRNNRLAGNDGADTIDGGGGRDTIWGGAGLDVLTGGDNSDAFVFNVRVRKANADTITDFTPDQDRIQLDRDTFDAIGGKLSKSEFYASDGATEAHGRTDHIIYDTLTGRLYYDEDARGGDRSVLIARLEGAPLIDRHDFEIV